MSSIAIITARGGSKRIPKKNIKEFYGKPMIAYAIDAARKSGIFDEIMVSTDSVEIADIAKKYGANVPFYRSVETASDFATTYDVLEEVLLKYAGMEKVYDDVCCIYPCVPFLKSITLKEAFEQYKSSQVDGLQPVCKYPVPIEWAMRLENGLLIPNDRELQLVRSQDLVPKYFDVGMFYFCKVKALLEEKSLTPQKTSGYVIDDAECQDIDTPDDWKLAEIKYELIIKMKGSKNGKGRE